MIRRYTIYSAFLDIKNSFLDIKNSTQNNLGLGLFLDIKKLNSWSRTQILDIKKSISISWYQEINFLISENNMNLCWYQEMTSWYQKFDFLIGLSRNVYFYFLISKSRIIDIKKCISWYQEMYFLISRNAE